MWYKNCKLGGQHTAPLSLTQQVLVTGCPRPVLAHFISSPNSHTIAFFECFFIACKMALSLKVISENVIVFCTFAILLMVYRENRASETHPASCKDLASISTFKHCTWPLLTVFRTVCVCVCVCLAST